MDICFLARYLARHTEMLDLYQDDDEAFEMFLFSIMVKHFKAKEYKTREAACQDARNNSLHYDWMSYLIVNADNEWDGYRTTTVFNPDKLPLNASRIVFHDLIDDLPRDLQLFPESGDNPTRAICYTHKDAEEAKRKLHCRYVTTCYRGTPNIEGCYRKTEKFKPSLYLPKKSKVGFTFCWVFHNTMDELPRSLKHFPDLDSMSDYTRLTMFGDDA